MCGRYAIFAPPQKLMDMFGLENLIALKPRYNAAPAQALPVIVHNRLGEARWGFGGDKILINARSETVSEKASFAPAWEARRRCLIPANGFYEWKKESGVNQPYYIRHNADETFAFAGLWTRNENSIRFVILTKKSDGALAGLHERMPVMFPAAQAKAWFGATEAAAFALMQAATGRDFSFHPVSSAVGKVANDSAALLERCA